MTAENPQVEDGYTRIANELLDAMLAHPFSKRELKILMAVIRKTYGYNKKRDDLPLSQLAKMTGLDRSHISRSVADLATAGVLRVCVGKYGQSIELNKKYSQWVAKTARVAKTATDCCQNSNSTVAKTATSKDNSKRQYSKDKSTPRKTPLPQDFEISDRVRQWAQKNGYTNLHDHLEAFKLKAEAKGYKYVNWDSAFMTAVRDNWAGIKKPTHSDEEKAW